MWCWWKQSSSVLALQPFPLELALPSHSALESRNLVCRWNASGKLKYHLCISTLALASLHSMWTFPQTSWQLIPRYARKPSWGRQTQCDAQRFPLLGLSAMSSLWVWVGPVIHFYLWDHAKGDRMSSHVITLVTQDHLTLQLALKKETCKCEMWRGPHNGKETGISSGLKASVLHL